DTCSTDTAGVRPRPWPAPTRPAGGVNRGRLPLDQVRHQDRVDVLLAATVVRTAVALPLEPEALVQLDRRLVPREDMQLELRDARVAGPLQGRVEQRRADATPAVRGGDHQAEVGD